MKYLKLFETSAEYQRFIGGRDFLRPNVSLINDTKSLFYNPLAQEEKELPYLTITALEDNFQMTHLIIDKNIQYSLNGSDWNDLSAKTLTPAINSGEKIYFKGILKPNSNSPVGSFVIAKRFNLSGNVMSMIFGDDAEGKTDLTGYHSCFTFMFLDCTGLEQVSKNFLPATTLAENCYNSMFLGCTSLVNVPELPATDLMPRCYSSMFQGCTSLNYIKIYAINPAPECVDNWLSNTSPTGTIAMFKDSQLVQEPHFVPDGWTVEFFKP